MTAPDVAHGHDVSVARSGAIAFDGRFRLAFVLFGGMVALQSSPTLDATKIVYLAGGVVCFGGALAAVWFVRRTPAVSLAAPWIAASGALAALIAISFLVARAEAIELTDWGRDVAAYALFAAVPVLALDGQSSASRRLMVGMLVLAGLLGGVSWAVEWLSRRHIVDLPLARIVFPSGQLPGMLYMFAIATAFTGGRRNAVWVLVAGIILGAFLLTATRSSLLLLVGPLAMALLLGRGQVRSSLGSFIGHATVAIGVVLVFQIVTSVPAVTGPPETVPEPGSSGPTLTYGPVDLGDRIGSLPNLVVHRVSDPSIKERLAQYAAAWQLFRSSPIVGVGPGHPIAWIDVSGYRRSGFTADTPLVMPAKFGLLGIIVFVGFALAFGATVRTALRRDRRSAVTLTLVGFGIWTVVALPLGFPVEDKGTSLALILLLALAFAETVASRSQSDGIRS